MTPAPPALEREEFDEIARKTRALAGATNVWVAGRRPAFALSRRRTATIRRKCIVPYDRSGALELLPGGTSRDW